MQIIISTSWVKKNAKPDNEKYDYNTVYLSQTMKHHIQLNTNQNQIKKNQEISCQICEPWAWESKEEAILESRKRITH
jgi:hypothetical protein